MRHFDLGCTLLLRYFPGDLGARPFVFILQPRQLAIDDFPGYFFYSQEPPSPQNPQRCH